MRSLRSIVVSTLSRVEVASAIWRKHRLAELSVDEAATLAPDFAADYHGQDGVEARFASVPVAPAILEGASRLLAAHDLRASDAIQLATALAVRTADPDCGRFACCDRRLRAAAAEGFAMEPSSAFASRRGGRMER
ncbi:hypothetical protein BH24ACT3_BH24ACT3_13610 [soil metagenome]